MKIRTWITSTTFFVLIVTISGCEQGQLVELTPTPTSSNTPTPSSTPTSTNTPSPTNTPTPTFTPTPPPVGIIGTITQEGIEVADNIVQLMVDEEVVQETNSDVDGNFAFLGLTPGDYTVVVLARFENTGVCTFVNILTVEDGKVTTANFEIPRSVYFSGFVGITPGGIIYSCRG